MVYAGALVNGPFAIVFGHRRGMVGLNDRIKLRPLVAAEKDDWVFLSSEESGILEMCSHAGPHLDAARRRTGHRGTGRGCVSAHPQPGEAAQIWRRWDEKEEEL